MPGRPRQNRFRSRWDQRPPPGAPPPPPPAPAPGPNLALVRETLAVDARRRNDAFVLALRLANEADEMLREMADWQRRRRFEAARMVRLELRDVLEVYVEQAELFFALESVVIPQLLGHLARGGEGEPAAWWLRPRYVALLDEMTRVLSGRRDRALRR